jgi:hypothetical protein
MVYYGKLDRMTEAMKLTLLTVLARFGIADPPEQDDVPDLSSRLIDAITVMSGMYSVGDLDL